MNIETQVLLNEFRQEQAELFTEDGKAHIMLSHVEPMNRMLKLIDALEKWTISPNLINEIYKAFEKLGGAK